MPRDRTLNVRARLLVFVWMRLAASRQLFGGSSGMPTSGGWECRQEEQPRVYVCVLLWQKRGGVHTE